MVLLHGSKPVYTDEFNKWAAACQTIELHCVVWFLNTTSGINMQIIKNTVKYY